MIQQQRRRSFESLLFLGGSLLLFTACTFFTRVAQNQTPFPAPPSASTASISSIPTHNLAPAVTNTPEPSPTTAGQQAARSTQQQGPDPGIVYYYFVEMGSQPPPAGSVVILQDELVLAPTQTNSARSPDPAANIHAALQAMLDDRRNAWNSAGVSIQSITFRDGGANDGGANNGGANDGGANDGGAKLSLEGEYFGAGDIVLIAARMQILLTVFAEAPMQTATILLNGENIANLGISHSRDVRPDDFAYTRAEIDAFRSENAYQTPAFNLEGIWQQNGFMAAGWTDRYHFYPSGAFHFYPNEMTCSQEKTEKAGRWQLENGILTLTVTRQILLGLENSPGGLCHIVEKTEEELAKPFTEQVTIVVLGLQEGDLYPSILINDRQFWRFSEDASSYGDE